MRSTKGPEGLNATQPVHSRPQPTALSSSDPAGVEQALKALESGAMTLDDLIAMFRTRQWPRSRRSVVLDGQIGVVLNDREPDPAGSFAEVAKAFYAGRISLHQYTCLADAVAETIASQRAHG